MTRGGGTALHALTWREAWTVYEPKVPVAEIAQRAPELALDYDFTCCVIEDRIAFLARHAGRPFPDWWFRSGRQHGSPM